MLRAFVLRFFEVKARCENVSPASSSVFKTVTLAGQYRCCAIDTYYSFVLFILQDDCLPRGRVLPLGRHNFCEWDGGKQLRGCTVKNALRRRFHDFNHLSLERDAAEKAEQT